MPVSQKEKRKKEIRYLENRENIRTLLDKVGYENMLRYMVEDLDHIDDISNTQSVYLFEIISILEKALEIYPRLKNV
jgi:hypothetical protein|tara:strand:- start:920 stop:1150 length:231 start_codon:yes stop_codon:yes gene_type:complete